MPARDTHVVGLACVTCGCNVDVSKPMDRFSCDHCGTLQVVDRSAGGVSLKAFALSAAPAVRTAETDPDAELNSLRNAVIAAENKHRQKKGHWKATRANRLKEWTQRLSRAKQKAGSIRRTAALISIFPSALIAFAVYGIARENMAADFALIAGIVALPVTCGLTNILVNEFLKSSERFGVRRLKRECSREFAKTDGRIRAEMQEIEKRLFILKTALSEAQRQDKLRTESRLRQRKTGT